MIVFRVGCLFPWLMLIRIPLWSWFREIFRTGDGIFESSFFLILRYSSFELIFRVLNRVIIITFTVILYFQLDIKGGEFEFHPLVL